MLGFKASKDTLTHVMKRCSWLLKVEANAHLPFPKILGPLRIMLNLLWSINGTTKPGGQHICLQLGFLNILNPLLKTTVQKINK